MYINDLNKNRWWKDKSILLSKYTCTTKRLFSVQVYIFLQVLSPRSDVGVYSGGKNRKKKRDERERKDSENNNNVEYKMEEHMDPATKVS